MGFLNYYIQKYVHLFYHKYTYTRILYYWDFYINLIIISNYPNDSYSDTLEIGNDGHHPLLVGNNRFIRSIRET